MISVFVAKGIESLFPVQSVSFDAVYDGCDVIVQASEYFLLSASFIEESSYGGSASVGTRTWQFLINTRVDRVGRRA